MLVRHHCCTMCTKYVWLGTWSWLLLCAHKLEHEDPEVEKAFKGRSAGRARFLCNSLVVSTWLARLFPKYLLSFLGSLSHRHFLTTSSSYHSEFQGLHFNNKALHPVLWRQQLYNYECKMKKVSKWLTQAIQWLTGRLKCDAALINFIHVNARTKWFSSFRWDMGSSA